ncbi:hypothetical protein V8F33_008841 [Rhypophila sp. PSN 637]
MVRECQPAPSKEEKKFTISTEYQFAKTLGNFLSIIFSRTPLRTVNMEVVIRECDPKRIAAASTFYPQLFNGFLSAYYRKWKTSPLPWHLRLVGGPGSGKTSLAILVVQDLGKSFMQDRNRVLLSAFFSTTAEDDDLTGTVTEISCVADLRTKFLSEIERQLDRHLAVTATAAAGEGRRRRHVGSAKKSKRAQIQVTSNIDHDEHSPSQYERIRSKISGLTVYLVLDDLDLAWLRPEEYFPLEETLAWLECLGVRILATSRTYHRKNTPVPECDVVLPCDEDSQNERDTDGVDDNGHRDFCLDDPEALVACWECVMCIEDIQIKADDNNVVCEACRRKGHGCPKPEHSSSPLVYKKRIMYIDMGNVLDYGLKGFIENLLQAEHGQFISRLSGDKSQDHEYPPLSNLGRQLLPSPFSSHSNHSADGGLEESLQSITISPPPGFPDKLEADEKGQDSATEAESPTSSEKEAVTTRSRQATRLINLLYGQSDKNIVNLLCRLETIHEIDSELEGPAATEKNTDGGVSNDGNTSLEAIFELENADRLPRSVVAMFDALFNTHIHDPLRNRGTGKEEEDKEQTTRAAIALHVIRHLARRIDKEGMQSVPFWELKETLLEEDAVCGHGFQNTFDRVGQLQGNDGNEEDAEINLLDYIIGTAVGLLTMGRGKFPEDTEVGFFHTDFRLYAAEDYNPFLASGKCC